MQELYIVKLYIAKNLMKNTWTNYFNESELTLALFQSSHGH